MRYLIFISVILSVGAAAAGDDAADKELKKLQGVYTLVSGELDGKTLSEADLENSKLVLKGNKHHVKVGDVVIKGTHKLDPSKKPRAIDASDVEGPYKDQTVLGIYKIEGASFTVCFAPPGKDRPTEFTTKSGTGHVLHTWKKAAKK